MSGEDDPAHHSQAEREARAGTTLLSCREHLEAAVRLLSMIDSAATSDVTGEERGQNAAIVRELQAAALAYDDLITNTTHDVKTSLTVIRGHAQMVARAIRRGDAIDREALLKTLNVIDTSATRISTELDGWINDAGTGPG